MPPATLSRASRRAVLFDLDGTLVDSFQGIAATVDAVLTGAGLAVCDRSTLRGLVGAPLEAIFGSLVADATPELCITYAETYRDRYWELGIPHTPLFPGMRDVLDACREAGLLLGVVTTKRVDVAEHLLDALGAASYFQAVIGGNSTPHHKPHPEPAYAALRLLGIDEAQASQASVVGDTTFDVEMAVAAGCRAIGVAWGNGTVDSLRAAGADAIATDAAHLRTLLVGPES